MIARPEVNNNRKPSSSVEPSVKRLQLALQFGWTFAEATGRLKHPLQWKHPPNETPRLFLSHPNATSGEHVWLNLQRLLKLCELLFPPQEELPLRCPPPEYLINIALPRMQRLIAGEKTEFSLDRLTEDLNVWSRDCWVQLRAESALLADAASLGGSLADTYWQLQLQASPHVKDKIFTGQTLIELIKPNRLHPLIKDIRQLESYLPDEVGSLLRHSLWEWGISDDLKRKENNHLTIAHPKKWRQLSKQHERAVRKLKPQEEKQIAAHLKHQIHVWEDLLVGRSIMLRPKDRRQIRWFSVTIYILIISLFSALIIIGALGVLALAYGFASWLFPMISRPTKATDWLTIGSALASVSVVVGKQLLKWANDVFRTYRPIYRWIRLAKRKQLSLHRWDGQDKSFWLILWQQIWYPQAR